MVNNHIDIPYPKSISDIPYRNPYRYIIDVRSPISISHIDLPYRSPISISHIDLPYRYPISISHIDLGSYLVTLRPGPRPPPKRELGNCYFDGEGVDQNFSTAADWYRAAGDQGREAAALMELGSLHFARKLGGDRGELPGGACPMMLAQSEDAIQLKSRGFKLGVRVQGLGFMV